MQLLDGAHHITFLTEDMDRLLAFYVRVFDGEVTLDMTEEGLRHAFLKVGPTTVLHPFQMLEGPGPPPPRRCSAAAASIISPCSLLRRSLCGSCVAASRLRVRPTATSAT